ncbi:MAG: sporulation protein [Candidatus Marinimicrobia bacterium]|nr:sporulation protein [Candidatus Neomarinimicrobiota bacterium]
MVENLLDTLLGKLKELVDSETVVGKPIQAGKTTVIPVTKISFGFGAGGGTSKGDDNSGTGTGGGAIIEPVAVIMIEGDKVRVHSLKESNVGKVIEMVPNILKKFTKSKESEGPKEKE